MQFEINRHEQIFQRLQKIEEPLESLVFEKFKSAYLFQIVGAKSFDFLLIIYKWQFLLPFSSLRDRWRQQPT